MHYMGKEKLAMNDILLETETGIQVDIELLEKWPNFGCVQTIALL